MSTLADVTISGIPVNDVRALLNGRDGMITGFNGQMVRVQLNVALTAEEVRTALGEYASIGSIALDERGRDVILQESHVVRHDVVAD